MGMVGDSTPRLIERRLWSSLDIANGHRNARDLSPVRMDIDIPSHGLAMIQERTYYRFRQPDKFKPLTTIEVTYKSGVFYFSCPEAVYGSDFYNVLKNPPNRSRDSETFFLADELDGPMDAIHEYLIEALAPDAA